MKNTILLRCDKRKSVFFISFNCHILKSFSIFFQNKTSQPNGVRYTSDQRVLLGGEWDFSYPLALVTHLKTAANITILCVRPQEDVACDSTVVQRVAMLEGLGATIHYNVDMADIGAVELPHLFDFVRWNNPPSRAFPRLWRADCAVKHFLQATAKLLKPGGATHIVSAIHFKEFNFPAVAEVCNAPRLQTKKSFN